MSGTAAGSFTGPSSRWRRMRSIEGAAIAGVIAAVGWVVALGGLLDIPQPDASDAEIARHYADLDGSARTLFLLQVLVFATVAFLWFVGAIRHRIGAREPKLFGTVFLSGGILMAGLLFVGAAAAATPAILATESDRVVDPDVAAGTRVFSRIVLAGFLPRVGSLFILSTSTLALRTGAMARWFVAVSYVVGVVMFVNVTVTEPSIYVFPVWIAAASLYLLILAKDLDQSTEQP